MAANREVLMKPDISARILEVDQTEQEAQDAGSADQKEGKEVN